jgi:hypothetical protein
MVEIVGSIPSCISHDFQSPCVGYGMVRWGSPETPSHKQIIIMMKYLEELLTLVALMAWFTYGYFILIAVV